MDYGIQNGHHLFAAPQQFLQPEPAPAPSPAVVNHLYSSYYSGTNPHSYPNQIVRHEDPSQSAVVYTDGGVVQAAEQYAAESGFGAQVASYGAYQVYQQGASFPYTQALTSSSFHQTKRKLKVTNILDLEAKKLKIIQGGAPAGAVRVCTICNVVCNSAKVFAMHLAGEKHMLKAHGRSSHTMAPKVIAPKIQMNYTKKPKPNKISAFGTRVAPKFVQSFTCEVCKIECNSQETFNTHKMGKKHRFKLQKLQEKITPKPPAASAKKIISSGVDQSANAETAVAEKTKQPSPKLDLQTKKTKVLQCGALEEGIKVCTLCNVVCNSKTVYELHVAGKKHLAMIKKQNAQV